MEINTEVGIGIKTEGDEVAVASITNVKDALDAAGVSADNFSLKIAQANQRAANATYSIAKDIVSGKNSWYDPNTTDEINLQIATQRALDEEVQNSAKIAEQAEKQRQQSLITSRYALYDLSTTYTRVGVASAAALAATVKSAADYESAFVGVARTANLSESSLNDLYDELINLSREIPESFTNLSEIATLGGQFGIAGESLAGFAENVAMFSATTNASIDETATGFARIAQLTDAGANSFDAIGSSIYTVGANSLATETEVMSIAQEIATAGNLAGFSTSQVIGLSAALASLGVQPYRARGNIQRVFADITSAAAEGGESLQQFASISGMSAQQFATSWKSNASDTFVTFIEGLKNAADSGASLDTVLGNLGISSSLDVQTLKQLADNTDILNQTMKDAATAYANSTSLSDAYGLVAETLSARLSTLKNSVQAVLAELGKSTILGSMVGYIQSITDAAGELLSLINGIGNVPVIGNVTTMLLAGVTAIALYRAGMLTLRATYAAVLTAQINLEKSGAALNVSLGTMLKTIVGMKSPLTQNAAALKGMAAAEDMVTSSTATMTTATKIGTAAVTTLKTAMKTFLPMLAIGVGLEGVSKLVDWFKQKTESAAETTDRFGISFSGLSDAMQQDMNTWLATGNATEVFSVKAKENSLSLQAMSDATANAKQQQILLAQEAGNVSSKLEDQIVVLGQASAAYLVNQISQSETFKKVFSENADALDQAGFSAYELGEKLASIGTSGTLDWLEQLKADLLDVSNMPSKGTWEYNERLSEVSEQANALDDVISSLSPVFEEYNTQAAIAAGASNQLSASLQDAGDSGEDGADGTLSAAQALSDLADTLFASTDASAQFESKMYDLGAAMANNGNDFSVYTASGRANLAALQDAVAQAATNAAGDSAAFAASLKQILAALISHGVDVANIFPQLLKQAQVKNVSELNNNLAKSYQNVSFQSGYAAQSAKNYASATRKVGNAAKSAAAKVYTLSDYVSDLSGIMKDAFDFRWGYQESVDDAAEAFQKLADYQKNAADDLADAKQKISDYRQEINKLKADLNGLYADKATLTYQLGVAVDYGDTLRAAEIQAELAQKQEDINSNLADQQSKNKDIADSQEDVSDAQEKLNKNLDGTTKSSRDQREMVLDLVSSYQDQIIALANSGASQDEVKRKTQELQDKFYSQMHQLGYNRAEADKYAKTFRDLAKVIDAVPKNITVSATMDPATRAIKEWKAKNTNGRGLSGKGMSIPVSASVKTPNTAGAQKWLNEHPLDIKTRLRDVGSGKYVRIGGRVGVDFLLSAYAEGGFTGRGNKYDAAGMVHKGEYVFPQSMVNQSTGLPTQEALAAMLSRTGNTTNITNGNTASVLQVELSPTDRNLLAQANAPVQVVLSATEVTSAVNRQNEISTTRGS